MNEIPDDPLTERAQHLLRVLVARWLGLEPGQGAHFLLDTATLSVLSHYRGLPALQRWNAPLDPA